MNETIERSEQELIERVYFVLDDITQEEFERAMTKSKMDLSVGLQPGLLDKAPETYNGVVYEYAAARIVSTTPDGKRPHIKPHYHEKGFDFVVFRKPTEVRLGKLSDDKQSVIWKDPYVIEPGGRLTLEPGTTHTWRAIEGGESDFVFCCPGDHLIDNSADHPEGDRYLTEKLVNGLPSDY